MDSWYASPERAPLEKIAETIEFASHNAVIDGLLRTSGGLVAVLNEYRQIIAINDSFLAALGIDDAAGVLGLRPGEALRCVHAGDMPGGCGTSRHCATCGAAIAIVATLAGRDPVERRCVATVSRNGAPADICLSVRAARIDFEEQCFVLLFLMDISTQQKQLAFERLFFHDISNLVMGLQGTAHMLAWKAGSESEFGGKIARMSDRLAHEIKIQRALLHDETADYPIELEAVDVRAMLAELGDLFASHPAAKGKRIRVECDSAVETVLADPHLLLRILVNMTTNALESTVPDGEVRIGISRNEDEVSFLVWNRLPIPEDVSLRVFQRYFSTKGNAGRGLGTYSMKLFGEQLLGGKMTFESSEADGTTFRFDLPA
jgi:nitrogen-specific signal transduction histidine kinase